MTFDKCNQIIVSIKQQTFGLVNKNGQAIQRLLPLPIDIKPEHIEAWIIPYWGIGIDTSLQPTRELLKYYEEFDIAYLFFRSVKDPYSADYGWVRKDFPDFLEF